MRTLAPYPPCPDKSSCQGQGKRQTPWPAKAPRGQIGIDAEGRQQEQSLRKIFQCRQQRWLCRAPLDDYPGDICQLRIAVMRQQPQRYRGGHGPVAKRSSQPCQQPGTAEWGERGVSAGPLPERQDSRHHDQGLPGQCGREAAPGCRNKPQGAAAGRRCPRREQVQRHRGQGEERRQGHRASRDVGHRLCTQWMQGQHCSASHRGCRTGSACSRLKMLLFRSLATRYASATANRWSVRPTT